MRSGVARNLRARAARRASWIAGAAWLVVVASGCFYGFAGGGLPRHLRSMAVLPFENETPVPEVQREVFETLRKEFQDRLNLRDAPEARADVLVKGVIRKYEVDLPVGVNADPRQATTARRKLQLVVDIEFIDQTTGRTIFDRKNLSREAQYAEGQELEGRKQAIQQLANEIIDGAQSNW